MTKEKLVSKLIEIYELGKEHGKNLSHNQTLSLKDFDDRDKLIEEVVKKVKI